MTYTVVLLNGKELSNLTSDQVKELFFKRQINQNSLIISKANPTWQMLKREFDLSQWIPEVVQHAPAIAPPAPDTFQNDQPFNPDAQFQTTQSGGFGVQNQAGPTEYTQNNQTQTFYQAETLPAENKLHNIQSNYAPTAVRYEQPVTAAPVQNSGIRPGFRPAAVFLIINAMIYVAFMIIGSVGSGSNSAESSGQAVGRSIIPLVIDIFLATRLWKDHEGDGARRWVLVRAYLGFLVGLIIPFAATDTAGIVTGVIFGLLGFFYLLALALTLHGKNFPSMGRVYAGIASFSVFVLVSAAALGLTILGNALPTLAKMDLTNPEVQKYKIEGSHFVDKTTGATVDLPDGWVMLSTSNPIVSTPTARMIAMDKSGERLAMLEVVPVPAELDMKRQTPADILDSLCDNVVEGMSEDAQSRSVFSKPEVKEMTRIATYIGKHPAKLMIVERTEMGQKIKGHVIITYDELTFYVLHSWCPTHDYTASQTDFQFFEKSFTVPESINSTFTQTAENERRK